MQRLRMEYVLHGTRSGVRTLFPTVDGTFRYAHSLENETTGAATGRSLSPERPAREPGIHSLHGKQIRSAEAAMTKK